MRHVFALCALALVAGCASAPEESAQSTKEQELNVLRREGFHVALGRCAGIQAKLVNRATAAETCIAPVRANDAATAAALPTIGRSRGEALFHAERPFGQTATTVLAIFRPVAPLYRALDANDPLRFYQVTASSCAESARFDAADLNVVFFGTKTAWGMRDIRVTYARELPAGWDEDRVRREVLYERAAFRGNVERPTFDILHPDAERPLLVTVFDLLPVVRSANRCP
jgi:hypothetical protein